MRMYLKNIKERRKKVFKWKVVAIIILLIVILFFLSRIGRNLNNYYLIYSENEARKIIMNYISKSMDNNLLLQVKDKSLYKIVRNKDNEIEMIDYNSYLVNIFLRDIANNVTKYLTMEEKKANEASFYIPIGSIFESPLLNNRGPSIPVKMELVGSVKASVNSKVTDYGINNSLLNL